MYTITRVRINHVVRNSLPMGWPSIVADQIKNMDKKIAGFEIINNAGFETENLFGELINEVEIQRRLEFLADRTLEGAKKTFSKQKKA